MAEVTVCYFFELNPDEISILLKLVGRESRKSISELGLKLEAFESLYATLTEAAYAPMREEAP